MSTVTETYSSCKICYTKDLESNTFINWSFYPGVNITYDDYRRILNGLKVTKETQNDLMIETSFLDKLISNPRIRTDFFDCVTYFHDLLSQSEGDFIDLAPDFPSIPDAKRAIRFLRCDESLLRFN